MIIKLGGTDMQTHHLTSDQPKSIVKRPGIFKSLSGYWAFGSNSDSYGPYESYERAKLKLRELALAKWHDQH